MLVDVDVVYIHAQRAGEKSTEKIAIPRATFEAFIDWYNSGEWRKRAKTR